jgi:GNAT superfamily N-acetyltransferase
MAASEHLNRYQMRYRPTQLMGHPDSHEVTAIDKKSGEIAGWLAWEPYGEIHGVEVLDPHKRRGVATAMLRHAENVARSSRGVIPHPEHSTNISDEGRAWVENTPIKY